MATILNYLGRIQQVFDRFPADVKALIERCDATDKRRDQFGPDDPEVQAGVEFVDNLKGKFTRRFAYELRHIMPEVGLRRKDVGAHATRADGVRHATDALMMRSDGKIVDVMRDRGPVWANRDGDFQPVDQWVAPLPEPGDQPVPVPGPGTDPGPGPGTQEPHPTPIDWPAVSARITALEARPDLSHRVAGLQQLVEELKQQQGAPAVDVDALAAQLVVTGKTEKDRIGLTHMIDLAVTKRKPKEGQQ
jgi:hypothetical protein